MGALCTAVVYLTLLVLLLEIFAAGRGPLGAAIAPKEYFARKRAAAGALGAAVLGAEAGDEGEAPGGEGDGTCGLIHVGGNVYESPRVELVPVMRAHQNLHDVVKQMILLEAHLFDPERTCWDCCSKHMLTIQALLEEAHSLVTNDDDQRKKLPVPTNIQALEQAVRRLHIEWYDSDRSPPVRHGIACKLRRIRKELMKAYARPLCN